MTAPPARQGGVTRRLGYYAVGLGIGFVLWGFIASQRRGATAPAQPAVSGQSEQPTTQTPAADEPARADTAQNDHGQP